MGIPFGVPYIDDADRAAVAEALTGNWILNGPKVRAFEERFGAYLGGRSCAAVNSCTAGMHAALFAVGVRAGDEVIMPALSFAANGAPVVGLNARPVFVDVCPGTWNINPEQLEQARTPKTKAILLVHYAGLAADMDPILEWAERHGVAVVEDAAHALGSLCHGRLVGSFGHVTVFSFGPLKHITTAGMGGMVVASPERIAAVRRFSSYGMDKSMWDRKDERKSWQYGVAEPGLNYRMTDAAAAMGCTQMDKLDFILAERRKLSAAYTEILEKVPGVSPQARPDGFENSHVYYAATIDAEVHPRNRDAVAGALTAAGIGSSVHWDPPLHLHALYRKFGYTEGDFPVTEKLALELLSLPLFVGMTLEQVRAVCAAAGWVHE